MDEIMETKKVKMYVYDKKGVLQNEFNDKNFIYSNLLERLILKYIGKSDTYKVRSLYKYDDTWTITFIDTLNGYNIKYENVNSAEIMTIGK